VAEVEHVHRLLQVGADKVSLGTAAVEKPELIREASELFGAQCVVVSIDSRSVDGSHEAYVRAGTTPTGRDAVELARTVEQLGAGEILLTSVDRDGTMDGYDLGLIAAVCAAVSVPVIASGGAGSYNDMLLAIEAGASAVAAASIFHFTEQTPLEAKRYLHEHGIPVRL
jgi:cyclase